MVEVTCRAIQGRLSLRPSALLYEIICGVLARGARLHEVDVQDHGFLSNRYHSLVSVLDALPARKVRPDSSEGRRISARNRRPRRPMRRQFHSFGCLLVLFAVAGCDGSDRASMEPALRNNLKALRDLIEQYRGDQGHPPPTLEALVD